MKIASFSCTSNFEITGSNADYVVGEKQAAGSGNRSILAGYCKETAGWR
jgi:hypothetical protein